MRNSKKTCNVSPAFFVATTNTVITSQSWAFQSGRNGPLIQLGAAYAGLTLVTLNPALRGPEIAYQLKQSKSVALFIQREYRDYSLAEAVDAIKADLPNLQDIFYLGRTMKLLIKGRKKSYVICRTLIPMQQP